MMPSGTAARPAWNADVNALIHAEQINMLYRQLPTSMAGNMVGALLLSGFLLDQHPLALIAGCPTALRTGVAVPVAGRPQRMATHAALMT